MSVQLSELSFPNVSRAVRIALLNEFLYLGVSHRKLEVVRQDRLEIVGRHVALIALVEQLEAVLGLLLFAALAPPVRDGETHLLEIDLGALVGVDVVLAKLVVLLLLTHLVETEVVQDVAEVRDRNVTCVFFIVEFEGVLQVRKDLTRQRVGALDDI